MGQTHSATSEDVLRFRQMVICTYQGDLHGLKIHFHSPSLAFQVSRATYLDICMQEEVQIESITDSLEKEDKRNTLLDEKMEFFSALEQKKIVLGDTLLHIGARLGYDEVVEFLLEQKVPTEIPNFQGILVKGCCATTCLRIVFDDCADVHELFGTDYKEEDKIHRMIRSMRRVWPLWMFEGQQEAGLLVRVLLDIRTSHTAFANLLKLTLSLSDRYRFLVSQEGLRLALELLQQHQGNAHEAKHTFTSQWNTEKKRTWLFQVFLKLFRSWKWRKNEERDCFYIDFLDSAMEAWINICEELHLNKKDLLPDAIVLKKYDLQIWKRRLHPPTAYLEELCVHINGLETYLQLTNLQAYN